MEGGRAREALVPPLQIEEEGSYDRLAGTGMQVLPFQDAQEGKSGVVDLVSCFQLA